MVVAESATPDGPAFEDRHPRFAYTPAELEALDTLQDPEAARPGESIILDPESVEPTTVMLHYTYENGDTPMGRIETSDGTEQVDRG